MAVRHDQQLDVEDQSDDAPLPLPIDRILTIRSSAWLVADSQSNRGPAKNCLVRAEDDFQVLELWLAEYSSTPSTLRCYKRDIARFYNWLALVRHKSLSSVTRQDLRDYDSFLANPPSTWCARRYERQTSERWRPLEGPMSPGSRRTTLCGVASCFAYMANAGYIISNPFQGWYPRRKTRSNPDPYKEHLSLVDFGLLVRALEARAGNCSGSPRVEWLKAERELFMVSFLGNTGLRREELTQARMSDIQTAKDTSTQTVYQVLRVRENGSVGVKDTAGLFATGRTVVLSTTAMNAIARYRKVFASTATAAGDAGLILLPIRAVTRRNGRTWTAPVNGHVVYVTVCDAPCERIL